jgi:L-ascorbate metabolism protein UlaG (beta-lactamase superfamily)
MPDSTRPDLVISSPVRAPGSAGDETAYDDMGGSITFVGTATVLMRVLGFTILTDPNFLHQGEHAPLGYGLRSRRLTEPALMPSQLPEIDVVVLSHHHGDHFDDRAAAELDKDLPIVTTPHAARKLGRQGFRRPIALETWESQRIVRGERWLTVTALPGKHAPQPLDALLPPVMGSMLEFGHGDATLLRLYITGDTLVHKGLHEIPRRYPDIHLALLHLGGTRILGITLTMDAEQGVEALRIMQPNHAIPIHYDDYTVFRSPLADFKEAYERSGLTTEMHYLGRGDTFTFTPEQVGGG